MAQSHGRRRGLGGLGGLDKLVISSMGWAASAACVGGL